MGAGGHLRWREIPQLRAMMDALIDGIEACAEPDGWLSAYTQEKMASDEHPDYTTSWTVHGFLEAAIAGNPKALRMIRAHMNVFNNHSLIPSFLPGDGGNWPWQVPAGPWAPGADNKTSSGYGTKTGHTIYLIVQGIIHSTRLALSPVGTQADVDLVKNLYEEPWWLAALAARDETVVGHKLVRRLSSLSLFPIQLSFFSPHQPSSTPCVAVFLAQLPAHWNWCVFSLSLLPVSPPFFSPAPLNNNNLFVIVTQQKVTWTCIT